MNEQIGADKKGKVQQSAILYNLHRSAFYNRLSMSIFPSFSAYYLVQQSFPQGY
jgi:hypothetical protein